MSQEENPWVREHSRTVNQRDFAMPPTWIAHAGAPPVAEPGSARHIFASGADRQLADRVVELLGQAERKAVVCSFLLADAQVVDAMLAAAGRGVHVYVLLASESRLESEPGDGEFEQRVYQEHKAMLTRTAGRILYRSAPHFHAKCVLVDPEHAPAGLLLTANLTSEALKRNEELALGLSADEVREASELMRWAMWESAQHELMDARSFRAVKPLGCLVQPPPGKHILATPSHQQLAEEALEVIDSARQKLAVASFGWEHDHPVVEYLLERARSGLDVTVLARVRPKSMPALAALAEAGARVFGFRWLHAKALVADSDRGLVMSANLERHGLDEGFELGVPLVGERAKELRAWLACWTQRAGWRLLPTPKLGELSGEVRVWEDKTFAKTVVENRSVHYLGVLEAESADDLDATPPFPAMDYRASPAHEIEYRWRVQAPKLARKAKQVMKRQKGAKAAPYDPPAYDERGGRRVVAVASPGQLPDARRVAKEADAAAIVVTERPKRE